MRAIALALSGACLLGCHRVPEPKPRLLAMATPPSPGFLEVTTRQQAGALPMLLRTLDGMAGAHRGAYLGHRSSPLGGVYADGGLVTTPFDTERETSARPHPADPNRWAVPLTSHDVEMVRHAASRCTAALDAGAAPPACAVIVGLPAVEESLDPSWDSDGAAPWYWPDGGSTVPTPPDDFADDAGVTANDSGPEGGR